MKYAAIAAVVAAAVGVAILRRDERVLAARVGVTVYPNGVAVVQVPYRRDGAAGIVSVTIDGRVVVRAVPGLAVKYGNDNYFFRPETPLSDRVRVSVSYDSGANAQMVDSLVRVVRVGEPSPASDESAPGAAAASVVELAKRHSADDKLPADPLTIIEELKSDMRWTAAGISPEQYVSGLNLWTMKKDLPIRTERMLGKNAALPGAMLRALADGGTVQAGIVFKRSGRVMGSRWVRVVRVAQVGDGTYLGIHDSAGPAGTDVYLVREGVLVDYAFSRDAAVVGFGFVQTWNK